MKSDEDDQKLVASVLASRPPPDVPADFVSRVNARIDETAGWFGLADFRLWTLRLAPVAAALGLIAVLWPAAAATRTVPSPVDAPAVSSAPFSPASAADWQQDVSGGALLDAALHPTEGTARVR
jgi:hypothetical protein